MGDEEVPQAEVDAALAELLFGDEATREEAEAYDPDPLLLIAKELRIANLIAYIDLDVSVPRWIEARDLAVSMLLGPDGSGSVS